MLAGAAGPASTPTPQEEASSNLRADIIDDSRSVAVSLRRSDRVQWSSGVAGSADGLLNANSP
jgi:hypothetical protein